MLVVSELLRMQANIWPGFYSRIFASLQQKDTSGHLTKLWQQDPFKAKWSIVARGYSSIRDHVGKANAPLGIFLKLVCPVVGIIGVENYLEKMNWVVEVTAGQISLHQTLLPNLDMFEPHFMYTSMTERDVINFVVTQGYITRRIANGITGGKSGRVGRVAHQCLRPQEGLLASYPTLPPPTPVAKACSANLVEQEACQWTGSMPDLCNQDAGAIDHIALSSSETWDVSDTGAPSSFEEMLAGVLQDGDVIPSSE